MPLLHSMYHSQLVGWARRTAILGSGDGHATSAADGQTEVPAFPDELPLELDPESDDPSDPDPLPEA